MKATAHQAFPPYPKVDRLPADLSERELYEFAFRIMAEQGDGIGDYLFAAIRTTKDHAAKGRWFEMIDRVQAIHGGRIGLTYAACERIAGEDEASVH